MSTGAWHSVSLLGPGKMNTNTNMNTHAPEQRAQAGHTPLPWVISEIDPHLIEGPNGCGVAEVEGDSIHQLIANRALILRAVNSHEALVEALRDMLSCADAGDMDALVNASADARAALALAEGREQ